MPAPPSGNVTFVFTDIEASTRLWEAEPARMADALARHDRLCRERVARHGGHVVKMTGDGMHAAFGRADAALAATVSLQRDVARIAGDSGLPFRMRCGLHAGSAQERDGDYFGGDVNRAARLMAAAHGGQILVSQAVAEQAREALEGGATLRHLGRVRLRDLSAPCDVWQVVHPELPSAFPALRSLDSTPNNLPQQLTSFVGRETEIAAVEALLRSARLLTLTGAGGCGKTRLALHVAADLLDAYPDGVWLVELATLSDPAEVLPAIAATLGLRDERGATSLRTVADHLASRRLLLLLDNAEHLLDGCARTVEALLRSHAGSAVMVSSREALGVAGEVTFRVPSLSLPPSSEPPTPERLLACESVRLFVERAKLHTPRFVVTEANAAAVASICARLDGIPLALELAAARMRSLSTDELHRRLDQRFRLLTGGSRTAVPRHQTLRSTIDWSYGLLSDTEKALLRRLSVFSGGWTLPAAEEVCAGHGIEPWQVLDLLTSLGDKSLVVVEERGGATRYRFLESMHEYASELFEEAGDDPGDARRRHLAHFLALAEEAEPQLTRADQVAWLERLEVEHRNLRAALARSLGPAGDVAAAARLATAIARFWLVHGYLAEGRAWLAKVLVPGAAVAPATRAKALVWAGILAWKQGDYEAARSCYDESLSIRRALGDRQGVGAVLSNQGLLAYEQGDYALARACHEESLAIDRELGNRWGVAVSLIHVGSLALADGDTAAARTLYEESLAIFRALGDRGHIANAIRSLADLCNRQRDHAAARALHEESLQVCRELGDRSGTAWGLLGLGIAARHAGDLGASQAHHDEGLAIFRELGDREGIAHSLHALGELAAARGDLATARALEEEGLAMFRDLGDRPGIATSIEQLAALVLQGGDARGAAVLWGAAARLRAEIRAKPAPAERASYDRDLAAARAALGNAFDTAWREGAALGFDAAIDRVLLQRAAGAG